MFVLFMQFLWLRIDDLVGKGLSSMVIAEFIFYAMLSLLPMGVPLSVLLASLMTFGDMGEKLELLSIKAAGVSLIKAMAPAILLISIVCASMLFFNHDIFPETFRKMRVLLWDIKSAKPELSFKNDEFNSELPGLTVRIGDRDLESGMLKEVMIYDKRGNNDMVVTMADSGIMKTTEDKRYMVLTLYNGKTYGALNEDKKKRKSNDAPEPFRRDTFQKQVVLMEIEENFSRSKEDAGKSYYYSLNYLALAHAYDSITSINDKLQQRFYETKIKDAYKRNIPKQVVENYSTELNLHEDMNLDSMFVMMPLDAQVRGAGFALSSARRIKNDITERIREEENTLYNSRRNLYELNHRIAVSLLSLLMFFIGAPLGAIVRKGGLGLPVVLSVAFFILYYIVDNFGRHLTIDAGVSAYIGAWLSTVLLLPIGIFLTKQATTDSVIMNVENYYTFFKKIFKKK